MWVLTFHCFRRLWFQRSSKQHNRVELIYFSYWKCVYGKLNPGLPWQRADFSKRRVFFASKLDLNWRKRLVKCYIWSIPLCSAETWTLEKVDQKYLESFEMWCWRRMENISWTDRVRNEEVLYRVKEQRNIIHICTVKRRKANWIGHILRVNCLLQRVTEGKIQGGVEVTGRTRKKK